MKGFPKPPPLVQHHHGGRVLPASARNQTGTTAKKVLSQRRRSCPVLFEYDKDNIKAQRRSRRSRCTSTTRTTPPRASQRQSKAAMSLCMWTRAMHVYSRVAKLVEPKKAALQAAKDSLAETMAQLKEKQDKLKAVQDNVARLEKALQDAQDEKQSLADQAVLTENRLIRAEKLTGGLADEQVRWKDTADGLQAPDGLARRRRVPLRGVHRVLWRVHGRVQERARR